MARIENEPQTISLDDTLETLEGVLPADQFELASQALSQMIERQKLEKEKHSRLVLISGIVLGYEKVIGTPGVAHTDGALIYSSAKYLLTPRDKLVPEELDSVSRLYAAYCVASRPYAGEDYTGKPTIDLIKDSGVDVAKVHDLLEAYRGSELPTLEEILENEEFYGEYDMEFLPHPGLAEKIKEDLFGLGYEEMYNSLRSTLLRET